jgi:hypothetical protein
MTIHIGGFRFPGVLGHSGFATFGLLAINRYATKCMTWNQEETIRIISS